MTKAPGAFGRALVFFIPAIFLQCFDAAASPSCKDGFQARGEVCVSQRMSDYIACLEASGGNKQEIETEFSSAVKDSIKGKVKAAGSGVVIKADGSIELDNNAEQSVLGKMKTKFYSGAMATCESVLKSSIDDKPKVVWVEDDGSLKLVNSGGPVKNFEVEAFVIAETFIDWGDQNVQIHGRYASKSPGVMFDTRENDQTLLFFPIHEQQQNFRSVMEKVLSNLSKEDLRIGLTYIQSCLRVEYDGDGGHYREYRLAVLPFNNGSGKITTDKMTYDIECKQMYSEILSHADAYQRGGQIGVFDFWSGNDESEITNVITTDLRIQIDRWKGYKNVQQ